MKFLDIPVDNKRDSSCCELVLKDMSKDRQINLPLIIGLFNKPKGKH